MLIRRLGVRQSLTGCAVFLWPGVFRQGISIVVQGGGAAMQAIIIGGSNSLKSGGWTSQLIKRAPEIGFSNLSIGAAPSIMGYYRLLTGPEFGAGDTVFWE